MTRLLRLNQLRKLREERTPLLCEQYQKGFTIVELLIVVVVVAILAAITVVSYMGIRNNTNDSAVQSDLKSFAKKVESYRITSGTDRYPIDATELATMSYKVSNGIYTSPSNFLYCRTSAGQSWAVVAMSRSNKVFSVTSSGELTTYTGPGITNVMGSQSAICPAVLSDGQTSGNIWGMVSGGWQSWAAGQ